MAASSTGLSQRGPTPRPRGRGSLRWGPILALGAGLACRGPLAIVSMAISVVTTVLLLVLAIVLARRGGDAPVASVPVLTSSALAWGGGFLHAVSVSIGALRRDRADGVRHLFVTRTASARGYLLGRVAGLAAALAATVGGGTLVVGSVAMLVGPEVQVVLRSLHTTLVAFVYALAFSAVIAPLALATLGARSRMSGYLTLLFVLMIPQALASIASLAFPSEVTELIAIPSALSALRESLLPGSVDVLRCLRALVALGVYSMTSFLFIRRADVVLGEEEGGGT